MKTSTIIIMLFVAMALAAIIALLIMQPKEIKHVDHAQSAVMAVDIERGKNRELEKIFKNIDQAKQGELFHEED